MQVFVNYPETIEGQKLFLNNICLFKANVLIKSIQNLNVSDYIKDDILKKVFEILKDKSNDDVI